jgi:hypothetical protein
MAEVVGCVSNKNSKAENSNKDYSNSIDNTLKNNYGT